MPGVARCLAKEAVDSQESEKMKRSEVFFTFLFMYCTYIHTCIIYIVRRLPSFFVSTYLESESISDHYDDNMYLILDFPPTLIFGPYVSVELDVPDLIETKMKGGQRKHRNN